MADTRLRAIIESIYQSQGTDAAKAGMQGVKQATAEMGIAQQAAQAQVDMLAKKMRELSAEVAKGNKTIDDATKEFNDYKATLTQIPQVVDETANSTKKVAESTTKAQTAMDGLHGAVGRIIAAGIVAKLGQEVLEFAKASVQAAGDAAELQSKFDVVFGASAPRAQQALEDLGEQVNRSAIELQGMAASIQDTFVPLGFARAEAANLSVELTQLAVDVGSFNNVADADVMRDFQSALVGNTETVRKYGIVITEANTKQKAYEMGITEVGTALTEQEKVQARLQLILEGTSDAQGDAIRTAESYANTMKGLEAATMDLKIAIGEQLNPALAEGARLLTGMVKETTPNIEAQLALWNSLREGNITYAEALVLWHEWILTGKDATDVLDELDEASRETTEAVKYWELAVQDVVDAERDWAENTFYAEQAQAALNTTVEAGNGALFGLKSAIGEVSESLDFWKSASGLLNEALASQAETESELNLRQIELLYVTGQITEAQKAQYLAANEQIRMLENLNTLLGNSMISWEQYLKIIEDGKITQDEMTQAIKDTWSAFLDTNLASDIQMQKDMDEAAQGLSGSLADVTAQFVPFAEKALAAGMPLTTLAGAAAGLKMQTDEVAVSGAAAALAIDELANAADNAAGTYNIHFNITQSGSIPSVDVSDPTAKTGETTTGFEAAGGPVEAGAPYFVGEQGTEVFIPDVPGTIIPNNQIGNMMGNVNVAPPVVYVFLDSEQVAARVEVRNGQNYRQRTGGGYRP